MNIYVKYDNNYILVGKTIFDVDEWFSNMLTKHGMHGYKGDFMPLNVEAMAGIMRELEDRILSEKKEYEEILSDLNTHAIEELEHKILDGNLDMGRASELTEALSIRCSVINMLRDTYNQFQYWLRLSHFYDNTIFVGYPAPPSMANEEEQRVFLDPELSKAINRTREMPTMGIWF